MMELKRRDWEKKYRKEKKRWGCNYRACLVLVVLLLFIFPLLLGFLLWKKNNKIKHILMLTQFILFG